MEKAKNERCPTCGEPVESIFDHVDREGDCEEPAAATEWWADDDGCIAQGTGDDYRTVAIVADAEFRERIVHRVNLHDKLVDSLRKMAEMAMHAPLQGHGYDQSHIEEAYTLIAKAEGK